jgi:hypothetical protein
MTCLPVCKTHDVRLFVDLPDRHLLQTMAVCLENFQFIMLHSHIVRSRYFYVRIATDYGMDTRVIFPTVQDFYLLHSAQTDSGADPASYPVDSVGSFPLGAGALSWPYTI